MGRWQNLDRGFFDDADCEGEFTIPKILPCYEIPKVDKYVQQAYAPQIRADRYDRKRIAVHFFEHDYKFERCWTNPDRYGEMLKEFGFVIGPDFSTYVDFPKAVRIYNHYRNNWLVRYWQISYNMIIVPTVWWGFEDSYDWCFTGLPKHSIVAVNTVGLTKNPEMKKMFHAGYNEMLKRLEPSQVLVMTRNYEELPGNVRYIKWELHKGDQLNG